MSTSNKGGVEESMPPIEDLKDLSSKLNHASDRVNDILRDAENQLRELNFGIEVSVTENILFRDMFRDKNENVEVIQRLSWGRHKGNWHLLVKTIKMRHGLFQGDDNAPYADPESTDYYPVLDANRELRFSAVNQLENLVSEVKKKGQEFLAVAEKASKVKV